jgi:hypothetical protein
MDDRRGCGVESPVRFHLTQEECDALRMRVQNEAWARDYFQREIIARTERNYLFVASKPNDLAGERRGSRSRCTPGNRNRNGIKPIGLDKDQLNTPVLPPFFQSLTSHLPTTPTKGKAGLPSECCLRFVSEGYCG